MSTQEEQLRQILSQSLSPDATTRQNAERALLGAQSTQPGHALAVLRVVSTSSNNNKMTEHKMTIISKLWQSLNENENLGLLSNEIQEATVSWTFYIHS